MTTILYFVEVDKKCTRDSSNNYHSYNDCPSVIYNDGTKLWHFHGTLHRPNGPAVITQNKINVFYNYGVVEKVTFDKELKAKKRKQNYHFLCTLDEKGEYHSYSDKPSLVDKDGTQFWHKNGILHRENELPAVVYQNGKKEYWLNGLLIKDNEYWVNRMHVNKLNKINEEKILSTKDENGKLHSHNDEPAVIGPNGSKYWYKDGKLHRGNGLPAILDENGKGEQWVNGKFIGYFHGKN